MDFIYPNKITYLNTFAIQLADKCLDNGGYTVLDIKVSPIPNYDTKANIYPLP